MATNNEEFLPVIYNADYPEEGNAYGEYYQVTIFGLYVWINYGITMCLSIASACSCNDIIKPKIKENKFKVKSVRVKG
ncbi:MAG: hypothetical protein LBH55_01740 [Mycoplasmataceae bacterium]|nr:hypothetical protein [Mycoplasmataceae bacterium]